MARKRFNGYSLLELLMVVAIISVVVGLFAPPLYKLVKYVHSWGQ